MLRQYLQSLKEYDKELTAKGLGKKCFVGRQNELDRILRTIKYDKCVKGTYLKNFLKILLVPKYRFINDKIAFNFIFVTVNGQNVLDYL